MNTKEYLTGLKSEYQKVGATRHLRVSGWEDIRRQIGFPEPRFGKIWLKNFAITFVLILLFAGSLFVAYGTVLAAMPGDPLYPVKILSEKIIQKATGNNQLTIKDRASEIVDLSKKQNIDKENLKQVVSEYKQNVLDAKEQIQISGKPSIHLQKELEDQHSEFDKLGHDNPEIQNEIKDAQEVSGHFEHSED